MIEKNYKGSRNLEIEILPSHSNIIVDFNKLGQERNKNIQQIKTMISRTNNTSIDKNDLRKKLFVKTTDEIKKSPLYLKGDMVIIPPIHLAFATFIPGLANILSADVYDIYLKFKDKDMNLETNQERLLRNTFNAGTETYSLVRGNKEIDPDTNNEIYLTMIISAQIALFELVSNVYKSDISSRLIKESILNKLRYIADHDFKDLNQPYLNVNTFDFHTRLFAKISYLFGKAPITLIKTGLKRKNEYESNMVNLETSDTSFAVNHIALDLSKTPIENYMNTSNSDTFIDIEKYIKNLLPYSIKSADNKRYDYNVSYLSSHHYLPILINRSKSQKKHGLLAANHSQQERKAEDDSIISTKIRADQLRDGFNAGSGKAYPYLIFGRIRNDDGEWTDYCLVNINSNVRSVMAKNDNFLGKSSPKCETNMFKIDFLTENCEDGNSNKDINDLLSKGDDVKLYISNDSSCKNPLPISNETFDTSLEIFQSTATLIIYLVDDDSINC